MTAEIGERTADHDIPVGLNRQRVQVIGWERVVSVDQPGIGVKGCVEETGVDAPVDEQASQPDPAGSVEAGEEAAREDLAVGLARETIDRVVGPGTGVERCVRRPAWVQAGGCWAGGGGGGWKRTGPPPPPTW